MEHRETERRFGQQLISVIGWTMPYRRLDSGRYTYLVLKKTMKKIVIAFVVMVGLLFLGAATFVYSGAYNVAADEPHWSITNQAIEALRDRSIEVRARLVDVPENLDTSQMISDGAGQYDAMCASCHLAPGVETSDIRPGLYPEPPNLSKRRIDSAEAFWVIKHGIKMSGMPAWGINHDDATIWSIVAFLNKLPELSTREYQEMAAKAGAGHGTAGVDGKDGHDVEESKEKNGHGGPGHRH